MQLNLPILDQLTDSQNILIAGAGGGFDIYSGLPIYFTLRDLGKTVHLANYSFCDFSIATIVSETEVLIDEVLMGVRGAVKFNLPYLPEPHLAEWFSQAQGEDMTIWMLANTGAIPLTEAYHELVKHLDIDAMILVDGGVDSIMRGDEQGAGTLVEDTLSLIAASATDVPVKILACIGFGTEVEESVCHYNALENMAALMKADAFLGSCSLTKRMEVFQLFEAACRHAWDAPERHQSHISSRIIPAGAWRIRELPYVRISSLRTRIFVSPLMGLYWFFDLDTVVEHSVLVEALQNTHSKHHAFQATALRIDNMRLRPRRTIPY